MSIKGVDHWYSYKKMRACFWLASKLANQYSTKKIEVENFKQIYHFVQETLSEHGISTKSYHADFEKHEERFDFSWTRNMTEEQTIWFLKYINKNISNNENKIKPPILTSNEKSEKRIVKGICIFDALNIDQHTQNYIYQKIKLAYSQKKKRDKNKQEKRKQCNISLSKIHFHMLNDIVNISGLTKQETIESLIYNYHDNNIENITTKILPPPKSLLFKK